VTEYCGCGTVLTVASNTAIEYVNLPFLVHKVARLEVSFLVKSVAGPLWLSDVAKRGSILAMNQTNNKSPEAKTHCVKMYGVLMRSSP
jgi:hypothetical protein